MMSSEYVLTETNEREYDFRQLSIFHTAADRAGSGGNDICKCHIWSHRTYSMHIYVVST